MAETRIVVWDRQSEQARRTFAAILSPLIVASRTKEFIDPASAKTQLHAWMLSMAEVPESVLIEAVALMLERGVTWMPKAGELKQVCAEVVDRRRAVAKAVILERDCPDCHNTRWREVVDQEGVTRVARCECWQQAMAAADMVGKPLQLALTAASEEPA